MADPSESEERRAGSGGRTRRRLPGGAAAALAFLVGAATGCPDEREPGRALAGVGEDGAYHFELALDPPRPRVHELFSITTVVREAATDAPVDDAVVSVDATMPAHGHGMITRPRTRALGGGRYLTEGMKLHMAGAWVLHARARVGARADALQVLWEQPPGHAP